MRISDSQRLSEYGGLGDEIALGQHVLVGRRGSGSGVSLPLAFSGIDSVNLVCAVAGHDGSEIDGFQGAEDDFRC